MVVPPSRSRRPPGSGGRRRRPAPPSPAGPPGQSALTSSAACQPAVLKGRPAEEISRGRQLMAAVVAVHVQPQVFGATDAFPSPSDIVEGLAFAPVDLFEVSEVGQASVDDRSLV